MTAKEDVWSRWRSGLHHSKKRFNNSAKKNVDARGMENWLIFDADDPLWENNIYFEKALEEFLTLLQPVTRDRPRVRNLLNEIERESIPRQGYGSLNFIGALEETFRRLYAGQDSAGQDGVAYLDAIRRIGDRLLHHPIDLLPGVFPTLQILRRRHRLMLFTKGDAEEQSGKLLRSGLQDCFDRVEVAEEKDVGAYRELILRHSLDGNFTCMVGNSPRSDVLPALAAELWAIFVPHPNTWELEHQEVEPHPRLLHAESIQEIPSLLAEKHYFGVRSSF